ncbi:MAG: hypothetical protein HYX77_03985 [Acidobacteria bacterium]|nr:hypothetical protein [Acidobacteriota bacterium]
MQQRRLRLGDILDDYCPRERRITNHAVVAMIDDQVKQTRCTTCDADHDYKAAKVPSPRRKRPDAAAGDPVEGMLRPRRASEDTEPLDEASTGDEASPEASEPQTPPDSAASDADAEPMAAAGSDEEDGPVHRRLIRATLPRPEGQLPERKAPDFTIRQPGGRGGREFDGNRPGQRFGQGRRPVRAQGGSQPPRFGGPRHGSDGSRAGSEQGRPPGKRPGHPGGPRGNRLGQGAGRGGGRKRGR